MPPPPAAGLPAMSKQSPTKTMSSRLMTMKFMQRGAAAAAAAAASSGTPEATSPATPRSEDGSAKRRKVSHTPSATSSPATPLYDQSAIQAAIDQEDERRRAAIKKRAAELGDSHWVLEGGASALPRSGARPLLNVVQVGFAQIDQAGASGAAGGDDDDDPFGMGGVPARPEIRRFNMKKTKAGGLTTDDDAEPGAIRHANTNVQVVKKQEDKSGSDSASSSDSGSDSDSEVDSEDESSPAPGRGDGRGRGGRNTLDEAERKRARSNVSGRREEERKKAQQLAGKRRKKEIKLNQLSSISSAGSQAFGGQRSSPAFTCHGCGKPGHKIADCPKKRR